MVEELHIKTKLLDLPEKKDEDIIITNKIMPQTIEEIVEEYSNWYYKSDITLVDATYSIYYSSDIKGTKLETFILFIEVWKDLEKNYINARWFWAGISCQHEMEFKTKGHIRVAIESAWMIFYSRLINEYPCNFVTPYVIN